MFTPMNTCMFGKNLRKHRYQRKKMENITNVDYTHVKRVCKDFEIKNVGQHHDLYLYNTLSLADVFESIQSTCLEIHEFNAACFFSASGLAWQDQNKITSIN